MSVSIYDTENQENYAGNLGARVFTQLREDILNGKYQPGDTLNEAKLCIELGVSRTPVREALRQLELEELVKAFPYKGVVVTGISAQDIEDIYTIRMMIEGLAARWAAEKITGQELNELKDTVDLAGFYTEKQDVDRLMIYDSKFHDIIFKASKSKPLMHTLSTFHHYVQRARSMSFKSPDRAGKALDEHRAILDAIIAHDPDRAEKLTTEHIRNASKNLISLLSEGLSPL